KVFAARGLEEFQPCRCREKQIARFNACAALSRREETSRHRSRGLSTIDADDARLAAHPAASDRETRDRTDRWQRFAAKTHCHDARKIVGASLILGKLRSGMTLDCGGEFFAIHAFAIVLDQDEIGTSARRCD